MTFQDSGGLSGSSEAITDNHNVYGRIPGQNLDSMWVSDPENDRAYSVAARACLPHPFQIGRGSMDPYPYVGKQISKCYLWKVSGCGPRVVRRSLLRQLQQKHREKEVRIQRDIS